MRSRARRNAERRAYEDDALTEATDGRLASAAMTAAAVRVGGVLRVGAAEISDFDVELRFEGSNVLRGLKHAEATDLVPAGSSLPHVAQLPDSSDRGGYGDADASVARGSFVDTLRVEYNRS